MRKRFLQKLARRAVMLSILGASPPIASNIRITLDSLHADYAAVTGALSISNTDNATHDATIKLITATDPGARTGDLAPIAAANLGVGVFKDEYVDDTDYTLRGEPLIGVGDYAGSVWYVRPESTYALTTGSPTHGVTYGDNNGKTYGDAFSGPWGYRANIGSITGLSRVYIVGEHILSRDQDDVGGRTISVMGDMRITQSGTSDALRTEFRYDYPPITVHGVTLDRGVTYGGLIVADDANTWSSDIVSMPYTAGTALVAGDKGNTIVMTTDGDTGTILDYNATHIWIGTDGTAGNSFDNSPTSGGAFTITAGTGTGTQDSAASTVSNLWWFPNRPSTNSGENGWGRDPGAAFGNAVTSTGYETINGRVGETDAFSLSVNTEDGMVFLDTEDTLAACLANEDSIFKSSGTGDPLVAHIIGGADPTNRVMSPSFGARLEFTNDSVDNISIIGPRHRQGTSPGSSGVATPATNYTISDFSYMFVEHGPGFDADTYTKNHSNYLFSNGCVKHAGVGIYPAKAANGLSWTHTGVTVEDVYFAQIGGGEFGSSDGHGIGSQGSVIDWTIQRCVFREGGNITLYDWGDWVQDGTQHQWGTVLIASCDLTGPMTTWPGYNGSSTDAGIHLNGNNEDDGYIGDGKATPPTTKADTADVTVQNCTVDGWLSNVRHKWKDNKSVFDNITMDNARAVDVKYIGQSNDFTDVINVPYTPGTALVTGDIGKTITMDTDGDTGTIIDYTTTYILVQTDGLAANNFDNSPTANDSFTITTGTGTGSQNAVGVAEAARAGRMRLINSTFGGGSPLFYDIGVGAATDYVIDADSNTFNVLAAGAKFKSDEFGTQTYANWQGNTRTGNGYNAEASVFDPNSTRQDP